jgi:hypothetical protein
MCPTPYLWLLVPFKFIQFGFGGAPATKHQFQAAGLLSLTRSAIADRSGILNESLTSNRLIFNHISSIVLHHTTRSSGIRSQIQTPPLRPKAVFDDLMVAFHRLLILAPPRENLPGHEFPVRSTIERLNETEITRPTLADTTLASGLTTPRRSLRMDRITQ